MTGYSNPALGKTGFRSGGMTGWHLCVIVVAWNNQLLLGKGKCWAKTILMPHALAERKHCSKGLSAWTTSWGMDDADDLCFLHISFWTKKNNYLNKFDRRRTFFKLWTSSVHKDVKSHRHRSTQCLDRHWHLHLLPLKVDEFSGDFVGRVKTLVFLNIIQLWYVFPCKLATCS